MHNYKRPLIIYPGSFWLCTGLVNCVVFVLLVFYKVLAVLRSALTLKRLCCVNLEDGCAVGMWGFTLIETRLKVDWPWNCLILTWLPAVMAPLSVITPLRPPPPKHAQTHICTHTIFFLWEVQTGLISTHWSINVYQLSTVLAQKPKYAVYLSVAGLLHTNLISAVCWFRAAWLRIPLNV